MWFAVNFRGNSFGGRGFQPHENFMNPFREIGHFNPFHMFESHRFREEPRVEVRVGEPGYGSYYGGYGNNYAYRPHNFFGFHWDDNGRSETGYDRGAQDNRFFARDLEHYREEYASEPIGSPKHELGRICRDILAMPDGPEYRKAATLVRAIEHSNAGHLLGRPGRQGDESLRALVYSLGATNFEMGKMQAYDKAWRSAHNEEQIVDNMNAFVNDNDGGFKRIAVEQARRDSEDRKELEDEKKSAAAKTDDDDAPDAKQPDGDDSSKANSGNENSTKQPDEDKSSQAQPALDASAIAANKLNPPRAVAVDQNAQNAAAVVAANNQNPPKAALVKTAAQTAQQGQPVQQNSQLDITKQLAEKWNQMQKDNANAFTSHQTLTLANNQALNIDNLGQLAAPSVQGAQSKTVVAAK